MCVVDHSATCALSLTPIFSLRESSEKQLYRCPELVTKTYIKMNQLPMNCYIMYDFQPCFDKINMEEFKHRPKHCHFGQCCVTLLGVAPA
jgi:hypothetical protein